MPVGDVEHERAEGHASRRLGESGQRGEALRHAGRIAVGIPQMIPGPQPVEAAFVGGHRRGAQVGPARAHGNEEEIGLHRGSIARRELGSPGAVAEAAFSWKAVSEPETLDVESDDERRWQGDGARWTPHLRGDCSTRARTL